MKQIKKSQVLEKNEDTLSENYKDILKELGNIGSGHAATALSNLLEKNVNLSLTSANMIPFYKISDLFEKKIFKFLVFVLISKNSTILKF